jgi:hypothetical protein
LNSLEDLIIATTFHEPEFRLKYLLDLCLPFIKKNSLKIIISHTPATHIDAISYLEEKGFILTVPLDNKRISSYLKGLEVGIDHITNGANQRIFYTDFDRLLHWIHNFPDEFTNVLMECANYEFLQVGRNPRAFNTHPETQKSTERLVNQIGSKILRLSTIYDLISVTYSFTLNLAKKLLSNSYPTDMGFYASWPLILWNNANNKKYIEVDGQEWETPDRFQKEINELGYDNWLLQFQTTKEWKFRVKLLEDCIVELAEFI